MRMRWFLPTAILIVIVCAAPVLAAEAEAPGVGAEEHKPALLTFDPGSAIWTIIVFIGLLLILRAFAWNPLLKALRDREKFIQESIDAAAREREASEKLLAEYKAQLDRARAEATAIVAEGRRDAEVVRKRIQDEARKEAEAMLERARREIRLATDAAVRDLYDRTAELSLQLAGTLISKELKLDDHRRLVDESLAQMKKLGPTQLS